MEREKLYLVCGYCGEAFDDIAAAKEHERTADDDENDNCFAPVYEILPESEAF